MATNLKKNLRIALVAFYVVAGTYHFINPAFYHGLIPDYLPFPRMINYLAGGIELMLALGVAIKKTRSIAVIGLVLMLVVFIPSHVYFIRIGSCIENSICVSPWVAWFRLLIIHPLLILWAWAVKD
mgnify:CR=1 FL=1|jgi:uncharacterized membrane protein